MRWDGFLDTARRLSGGNTEGDWRSAISRGYYAAFHYFREFLLSHGLDIGRGGQSHSNLYVGLNNCGFTPLTRIASRIDGLRTSRVKADYDLNSLVDHTAAVDRVNEAQTLIADFQALLNTLPPVPIVAGARHHLQSIGRLPRTP